MFSLPRLGIRSGHSMCQFDNLSMFLRAHVCAGLVAKSHQLSRAYLSADWSRCVMPPLSLHAVLPLLHTAPSCWELEHADNYSVYPSHFSLQYCSCRCITRTRVAAPYVAAARCHSGSPRSWSDTCSRSGRKALRFRSCK